MQKQLNSGAVYKWISDRNKNTDKLAYFGFNFYRKSTLYDVNFMRTQNQNEFKIHQGYKTGRINY